MSALELSVCLCSHQPRPDPLARTLEGLRAQTLPLAQWELLFIDNASTPPLAPDLAWHPQSRVVREEKLGLTAGRLRAIRETSTSLLVLVDDDNVLHPDYLENVLAIARAWPVLGAWGGQCHPSFECEPPAWTRPYWHLLGIREFSRDEWTNVLGNGQPVPIGAGLCVRRAVAERYAQILAGDPQRAALDRTGQRLLSCGDTDLALTALDLGLGTGMFVALHLTHLLPASRLEENYLRELLHGITYSATIVGSFRGHIPSQPSRSQRLLKWWQARHLPPRERAFDRIVLQAEAEALADLARSQNGA